MSEEEIIEKFQSGVAFTDSPILKGNSKQIIKLVNELENVGDVSELIHLLIL